MSDANTIHIRRLLHTIAKILVGLFASWMVGVIFVNIFDYHSWIFFITSFFFFVFTSALLMRGDSDG